MTLWHTHILLILVLYLLQNFNTTRNFERVSIYYAAPEFNLRNTNITLASTMRVGQDKSARLVNIGEVLAVMCQADFINRKEASVEIDGIINIAIQQFNDDTTSQDADVAILENSLYFKSNGTRLNSEMKIDLMGFFGIADIGTEKINSLTSNLFDIPFVTAGELGRNNPDNLFLGNIPAENRTIFKIQTTTTYNSFDAVLDILEYFNWTVVGTIYQPNTLGYTRQANVLDYSAANSSPVFVCSAIIGISDVIASSLEPIISQFCACIDAISSVNVVILWMEASTAVVTVNSIRRFCPWTTNKWTYIVADDNVSPYGSDKTFDALKYSLLLRDNGPWPVQQFLTTCQENAKSMESQILNKLFESYYALVNNCEAEPESEEYRVCAIANNGFDVYASQLFFASDSITTYAEGVYLLQNNCTFLNEQNTIFGFPLSLDFCNLTVYTPAILNFALRFVNFTGYTGDISFANGSTTRQYKSYFLYNGISEPTKANLTGILNYTTVTIYEDLIQFVNGKVPISQLVPQNPDLSYAVVVVAFAFAIIEIVICTILLLIFGLNMNERVIRQNGSWLNVIMLAGVFTISVSQLMICFGNTDALCTIDVYFFRVGICLLLTTLIFKTYRIYLIFCNKTATPLSMSESSVVLKIFGVVFVYTIFITVFVAIFGYDAVIIQSTKNEFYQYVTCKIPSATWNTIFQITATLFLLFLLFVVLCLAWMTRNVGIEYRESSSLASFTGIISAAFIIFFPLYYVLNDEDESELFRFIIRSEFAFISIWAAFFLLFFPKVYALYKDKRTLSSSFTNNTMIRQ